MNVNYRFPGDFTLEVTDDEIRQINSTGHLANRQGVCGFDTKTWVRALDFLEQPRVQMDAASDLYFDFPEGRIVLPHEFTAQEVDTYMDTDQARALHFFGETGKLVVRNAA